MTAPPLLYTLKSLTRGNSLVRTYFNWTTQTCPLRNKVLDVGAGRKKYYHEMPTNQNAVIQCLDQKLEGTAGSIDLEKDDLPFDDSEFDQVLVYNLLEHIFHYDHLLEQCGRVLKHDGQIVGFVPFLVRYHPDPHDYFRYTNESLQLILTERGFSNIKINALGGAMFSVQFQSMSQSLPKYLSAFLYPLYRILDDIYLFLRPHTKGWYALGYFFTAKKCKS